MILNEQSLFTSLALYATSSVLTQRSLTVSQCAFQKFVLSSSYILVFALPSAEHGRLQCTSITEGQSPWLLALESKQTPITTTSTKQSSNPPVDCVQVNRRFLLGLSTGQEGHTGNCSRYSTLQSRHCSPSHILRAEFHRMGLSSSDHVRFQQRTLQEHVMIIQSLVDESEDSFGDLLGTFQIVRTIGQYLRFYDWHDAVRLTDGGVAGQNVCVLDDGLVGRCVDVNLEDRAPFGKMATVFFVLSTALSEIVQTWGKQKGRVLLTY